VTNPLVSALEDDRAGLEVPWPSLAALLRPLPGSLMIVLGAPGSGKSLISLSWLLKLTKPSRLLSLDTDSRTQGARTVAALTGASTDEVMANPRRFVRVLDDALRSHQLRVLDRSINPRELRELIECDAMYWGEPPALVVVDDVSKFLTGERGFDAYDEAFARMHSAAREFDTVVMALHHIRRNTGSAAKIDFASNPIGMSDGRYGGEYEAEMVLGLWRPHPMVARVGVLKNRYGPSAPDGSLHVDLRVDPLRVQFVDDWGLQPLVNLMAEDDEGLSPW
jgi:KaiC/GvpD/RAD55 family RecA-like ATPase